MTTADQSADTVPWWASDDPWQLSPDEAADLAARRAKRMAAMAAMPDPPFGSGDPL